VDLGDPTTATLAVADALRTAGVPAAVYGREGALLAAEITDHDVAGRLARVNAAGSAGKGAPDEVPGAE